MGGCVGRIEGRQRRAIENGGNGCAVGDMSRVMVIRLIMASIWVLLMIHIGWWCILVLSMDIVLHVVLRMSVVLVLNMSLFPVYIIEVCFCCSYIDHQLQWGWKIRPIWVHVLSRDTRLSRYVREDGLTE